MKIIVEGWAVYGWVVYFFATQCINARIIIIICVCLSSCVCVCVFMSLLSEIKALID